jgi:hypothetical protein
MGIECMRVFLSNCYYYIFVYFLFLRSCSVLTDTILFRIIPLYATLLPPTLGHCPVMQNPLTTLEQSLYGNW